MEDKNKYDDAEYILKDQGARIQTFLVRGQTQYVVKKDIRNVSPSFDSISALCNWVLRNTEELLRTIRNDDC